MIFYVLLILLSAFAFLDVWYIVRFIFIAVKAKINRRDTKQNPYTVDELTSDFVTRGIVLPSDLDIFVHMNNSKYFKEFDLARVDMAAKIGFLEVLQKHGGIFVVGAGNIRYRRPMKLFQTYKIKTRIVCWDEKAFYVEQEMVTAKGVIAATMNTKIAMKGITTDVFIKEFCGELPPSPEPTDAVVSWKETLEVVSSSTMQSNGVVYKRTNSISSLDR